MPSKGSMTLLLTVISSKSSNSMLYERNSILGLRHLYAFTTSSKGVGFDLFVGISSSDLRFDNDGHAEDLDSYQHEKQMINFQRFAV